MSTEPEMRVRKKKYCKQSTVQFYFFSLACWSAGNTKALTGHFAGQIHKYYEKHTFFEAVNFHFKETTSFMLLLVIQEINYYKG